MLAALGATLLILAGPVVGAVIEFEASSTGAANTNATCAWSHTVGGLPGRFNRLLVVGVSTVRGTTLAHCSVSGVTFGALAMTRVPGSFAASSVSPFVSTELWYLLNPPVGPATITVTFASSEIGGIMGGAVSLAGVLPAAPEAVAALGGEDLTTSYSLGITTISNGAWLVDIAGNGSNTNSFTAGAGLVERWDRAFVNSASMSLAGATRPVATAGAVTDIWTASVGSLKSQSIAAFAPAPENTPPLVAISTLNNGATVGANFTIGASAEDSDGGTIASVSFYDGATLLGTDVTSPFSYSWAGAPDGAHALTAVAVDNHGAVTTSSVVNLTVAPPISLGVFGTGIQTFGSLPPVNEWTTLSVAGLSSSVEHPSGFDVLMAGLAASDISAPLPSQAGSGAQGQAYWRSANQKLGTEPTGNQATLLMASLRNTSGSPINGLTVAYTLGGATAAPTESLKGHRIYWSLTGLAGSWTAAGDSTLATAGGTLNVALNLPAVNCPAGGSLYLVWLDDNGVQIPEGDFTIDNVNCTAFANSAVTITGPNGSSNVGSDLVLEATAVTTNGAITSVSFYDGATLLGTDTTAPFNYIWTGAAAGSHALTAVATDSNSFSATSPVQNVTVVAGAGTLTRGPYLQKAAPTQMAIRWRNSLYNQGRVRFGTTVETLTQTADEPTAPQGQQDHEVTLSDLTPGTTYYYSVGSGADTLASGADYTFTTPPVAGTGVNTRVWVLGDAGSSGSTTLPTAGQTGVRDAFYTWTGARTPDLVLQLGDNAYEYGTDTEFQKGMFDIYPTMLRKTPFWSCLGNHETAHATTHSAGYAYFDIYTLPKNGESGGVASGTEHYYSFDYGNIHFISLDSTTASRAPNGAMATWLQNDLASTTATWIICFFHHPPYSKGSHNSDTETELIEMRTNILPILEAGGVDLVLTGHSHCYERSFLLDSHYGLSASLTPAMKKNTGDGRIGGGGAYIKPLTGPRDHFGAVYAVAGSAGKVSGGALNHPAHFISMSNFGSLVLDVNGTRLDATFIRENGTTPDTFTIIKQGAADTDGDGIPDAYEIAHGLNRFSAADAPLDSDGDGLSNLMEFIFATASNVPDSYTFTSAYDSLAGTTTVTFPTVTGRTYRVMYSHDLLIWHPGSSSVAGTGAPMQWLDDGTVTGSPPSLATKRFYRMEVIVVQ